MSERLNRFRGEDTEFYFRSGQIVTLHGKMFQHQIRYADSFGSQLIGHYMIDEDDFQVEMKDASLTSFRIACDALVAHSGQDSS